MPWLTKMPVLWLMKATRYLPYFGKLVKRHGYAHFCGGKDLEESMQTARALHRAGGVSILDYAVENQKKPAHFEKNKEEIIRSIKAAARSSLVPFCVAKPSSLGDTCLMAKAQRGAHLTSDESQALREIEDRLDVLCETAKQQQVGLLVDAEEVAWQCLVDGWVLEAMKRHNKAAPVVYNTFQFYLKKTKEHFLSAHAAARSAGFFLGAKLVRGAYMEKERREAHARGYPSPIQDTKEACDRTFNEALVYAAEHHTEMGLCIATHNEYSNRHFIALMEQHAIPKGHKHIFFAQLLGMSDTITFTLAAQGYNAAKYIPYGPFEETLPYLYRRLQENSSVKGQVSKELYTLGLEIRRRQGNA